MKTKKAKRAGILITSIGIGIMILLGIASYCTTREKALQRMVQRSVQQMDAQMEQCIQQDDEEEQNHDGWFVYENDSLLYWNRNDVSPKLMRRKVTLGRDTICSLQSGYYYIKSYAKERRSYYVFKLLSTDYPIHNRFFTNNNEVLPKAIDAKIKFQATQEGTPIYNQEGKLLAFCQIESQANWQKPMQLIFLLPLILIGIGLAITIGRDRKQRKSVREGKFEIGLIAIFISSMIGTYIYAKIVTKQENEDIQRMAERLTEKRDGRFEMSFAGFLELVKTDSDFNDMVFAESNVLADVVLDYSKELLFDDNMNAYIVTLTLCAPEEEIAIQPQGYIADCEAYFNEKLNQEDLERVGEGLYFMDYYTLDPNYLGRVRLYSADSTERKTLYYEFYKPVVPEGFGFPRLLQQDDSEAPYDYSVANYRDQQLVYKYGRYVYPNYVSGMKITPGAFSYSKHYKHYAIQKSENIVVISAARKGWTEVTAPFALFFFILLVPYLLGYWIVNAKPPRKWRDRSFRQRLRTTILLTLGISFLAVGPVSVIYMRSLYNQNTANNQFETTRTLLNEMRNDVDFESLLQYASRDRWEELLQRYANTFFTDINVYALNGQLLATTRPEINELSLQAPIMNAEAYQNIHRNHALYYTHEERLGKGIYESAYIPLTDANGITLAYLNTPYFSSVTDLQKEIRNFVLTYINLILVLFCIALIFVLRLTKRLTEPLALIQNKLGDIKIDQQNEPIEWKGNDEIGALVKQYNQLIVELEKSANELRRTTAESAWRGVARQVAHEIHNSLTPMRLSVQMLEQATTQHSEDLEERIQHTTSMLIEQIDALSDIASSFSQYAKMPVNHPQPLDLAELVGNLVRLYDNEENISFQYHYDTTADHTFNGDRTNLNSAIGNIIKNAVQAIGSQAEGRIEVRLKAEPQQFAIQVKDNGKGIKEADKKMIFVPNFTTKTGGSGVGLSLAYNIIQSAGGRITFESQEGQGATFVVELPRGAK